MSLPHTVDAVRDAAFAAYQAGLCVVPPKEDGTKAPFGEWKEYEAVRPAEGRVQAWYANSRHGVGLITGKVSGNLELLEFDAASEAYDPFVELARAAGLGDVVDRIEAGYLERSPSGGIHWLYHCSEIEGNTKLAERPKRPEEKKHPKDNTQVLIETRGEGGYVIVAPSFGTVHETRRPYELLRGSFETIATITPEERTDLWDLALTFDQMPKKERPKERERRQEETRAGGRPGDDFNARTAWPEVLEPHGWERVYERGGITYWLRPGKKLGVSATTGYGGDHFYPFTNSSEFESQQTYSKFAAYAVLNHGSDYAVAARELAKRGFGSVQGDVPQGRNAFPRTDSGNAELFAHLYGDRLRYDHRRKQWLLWQGHWWASDSDGEPTRLAKAAARHRYESAADIQDLKERQLEASWAIGSENRGKLDAAIALAQAERPIALAGDAWDLAPWLLGVGNGVLELRTGSLRPGRSEDGITFHAGGEYVPEAKCPRWLQFLEEIFGGDQELIGFMKRSVGYALTGDVGEQVWWLLWGSGSNGKGLFLNTLLSVLGLYAANTPFTTFEARDRPTIPSDLAALAGKRFVTASETNEGIRLNEARLKAITGGDPVTARFLFGEFFTYRPALKLFLAVNHRPIVKDDSPGFWRRVLLIPFTQSFIGREDKGLSDKLLAEAEGILAWAVEGCMEWQESGFRPPQSVLVATQDYRAQSDSLTAFLAECCEIRDGVSVQSGPLYNSYSGWMKEEGRDDGMSQTAFGTRMAERFEHSKGRPRIFSGVGLKNISQAALPPSPSTGLQIQNDGFNGFSHQLPQENPSRGDLLGNAVEPVEQIQNLVANPLPHEEPVAPAKQGHGEVPHDHVFSLIHCLIHSGPEQKHLHMMCACGQHQSKG